MKEGLQDCARGIGSDLYPAILNRTKEVAPCPDAGALTIENVVMKLPKIRKLYALCAAVPVWAGADALHVWPDPASMPSMAAVTSPSHPDYPGLPDPLRFFDHSVGNLFGPDVVDGVAWRKSRRPEILDMLRHYMYGYEPVPVPVAFSPVCVDTGFLDGLATKKLIVGDFGIPGASNMTIALYLPNAAQGPVPVIVALNNSGNETIEPGGNRANRWDLPSTLRAGIALATAYVGDFSRDSSNSYRDALIEPFSQSGFDGNWRTIGAWAWGLGRMIDSLETNPAVDSHRIAVTGFSRRGKAAFWAGTLDERIALVGPHQSGAGGPLPNRPGWGNNTGYRTQFRHWFLQDFNEMPFSDYERLPFDQHFQVALMAPRRAFFTENSSSGANFDGANAIRVAAEPVWTFLGADAETGVVLDWDSNSSHQHEPYHWAALHDAVLDLPRGGTEGFRRWAVDHGLVPEGGDSAAAALMAAADLNGDGTSLLEAYLFGLDPSALNRVSPVYSLGDEGRFRIQVPQRRDGTGLPGRSYRWRGVEQRVEWAEDPAGPWSGFDAGELVPVAVGAVDGAAFEMVTFEDRRSTASARIFFRLGYRLSE